MAPVVRAYVLKKDNINKHIVIVENQQVMDSLKLSPDTARTMMRGGIGTTNFIEGEPFLNGSMQLSPCRKFFRSRKYHGPEVALKAMATKAKRRKKRLNVSKLDKSMRQVARPLHKKEGMLERIDCVGFRTFPETNTEPSLSNSSSTRLKGSQSMIPVRVKKLSAHSHVDLNYNAEGNQPARSTYSATVPSSNYETAKCSKMNSNDSLKFNSKNVCGSSAPSGRPEDDEKSVITENTVNVSNSCCFEGEEGANALSADRDLKGTRETKEFDEPNVQKGKMNELEAPSNRRSFQGPETPQQRSIERSQESFYGFPCLGEPAHNAVPFPTPKFAKQSSELLASSIRGAKNSETISELYNARYEWLKKLKTCQMEHTVRRRAFSINDALLKPPPASATQNIVAARIANNAMEIAERLMTDDQPIDLRFNVNNVSCQTEEAIQASNDICESQMSSKTPLKDLVEEVGSSFDQLTICVSPAEMDDALNALNITGNDMEQNEISLKAFSSELNLIDLDRSSEVMVPLQKKNHKTPTDIQFCHENDDVELLSVLEEYDQKSGSVSEDAMTLQLSFPLTPRDNSVELDAVFQGVNSKKEAAHEEDAANTFLVTPVRSAAPRHIVDLDETAVDHLSPLSRWVLPPGKKYRRSLSIIRHLEGSPQADIEKGRNYEQSVKQVIKLQSRMGDFVDATPLQTLRKRLSMSSSLMKQMTPRMAKQSFFVWSPCVPKINRFTLYETPRASFFSPVPDSSAKVTPEEKTDRESDEGTPEENSDDYSTPRQTSSSTQLTQSPVYTIKDLILTICKQTEPCSFSDILSDESFKGGCKLGEGVFGEVFSVNRQGVMTVLKIIPIEGTLLVNGERQKTYDEILSEIVIAKVLHELRFNDTENLTSGFAELIELSLVQGRYPEYFLKFWREFDESKGSDNDYPNLFSDSQLFIVLEQGNGGKDLESYTFSTAKMALAVFKQIAFSLAAAECSVEFEHRDLHWGNILVSRTSSKQHTYKIKGRTYTLPSHGVKTTIIDYTLSRIKYINQFPIYNDIGKDPGMFIASGDYQFDVYRLMKADVNDDWSAFAPKTNVRWLVYLADKMTNQVKYSRLTSKVHRDSIKIFEDIRSWIELCDSAFSVALKLTGT